MKKIILLFLLLPILCVGQTDLVRYNGISPTLVGSNITAGNMSVTNGSLSEEAYAGFRMVNTSGVSGYNSNSYFSFSISASSGYNVILSQFEFTYIPVNYEKNANTVRVSYSTTANFSSGVQSLSDVTIIKDSNSHLVTLNFPANTAVASGQTMYMRMYLYNSSDPWWNELRVRTQNNPSAGAHGPTIRGSVNTNTLLAVNDNVNINPNTSTAINVIANDSPGPAPINSVVIASQPTNSAGSVSVNPDKTIQFVPTQNFYGTSSFTYTISNGLSSSTATVNITITWPAPSGALCGTYYIGTATQQAYPQFTTLTAALAHLNTSGISCNVTFLLGNTTYTQATETFPLIINSYTGNTAYTTTIKPFTGTNVTVSWDHNGSSTPNSAIFKLNGADNVTIDGSNNNTTSRNLTLYNNLSVNPKRSVVWIGSASSSNGATGNTIKNLTLQQFYKDDDPAMGVFSGSGTTLGGEPEAANTGNTISNVLFSKVGYAIYVKGSTTYPASNWKIQNNSIGGTTTADKPFLGVYMENATGYEVSGNSIIGLLKNTMSYNPLNSGIMIEGTSSGSIFRNIIRDVYNDQNNGTCSGIYLNSGNTLVYNNMISDIRQNSTDNNDYSYNIKGHGIFMNSGANNAFYFNTIHMNATTTGGRSSCIYIAAGSAVTLRSNILYNSQTQGTQYTLFSALAIAEHTTDYNDFVSGNTSNIRVGGTAYSLTTWKNAGKDTNSKSVLPSFVSATDLRLTNPNTNNASLIGLSVAGITTDIDGTTRSLPSMGAHEYYVCNPTGNPSVYGNGSWIGYVYTGYTAGNPPATPFTTGATYRGFLTKSETFDQNLGAGALSNAVSGVTMCGSYTDDFAIRYRMTKNFPAGNYTFTVGADDGVRLSLDGGATWHISDWSNHAYGLVSSAASVYLSGNVNLVLEYYEGTGDSRVSFSYALCGASASVAPTSIMGTSSFCASNTNLVLTAVGGTLAAGSSYQWGTGSVVGSNIIAGTANTITVSPSATTTYWVRIVDAAPCSTLTTGVIKTLTLTTAGSVPDFGSNIWNVLVYSAASNNGIDPVASDYKGYYTQNLGADLGFDTEASIANSGWDKAGSPSYASGYIGCVAPIDEFTIVHKRKGFPCGRYEIKMENWDDDVRVYINNSLVYSANGWSGNPSTAVVIGGTGTTYALTSDSTIEVRVKEGGGDARAKMSLTNIVSIYNGTWNTSIQTGAQVQINANLTLTSDLSFCSCVVAAGKTVTVNSGSTLIVDDFITVGADALIDIKNAGSLVQVKDAAAHIGNIKIARTTTPVKKFDYTYWSSPIKYSYNPVNEVTTGTPLSTLSNGAWSYYFAFSTALNTWATQPQSTLMENGVGYIARAPLTLEYPAPSLTTTLTAVFEGVPNTGIINTPILKATINDVSSPNNLIGNPYPSALSADAFIRANIYNPNSSGLTGTINQSITGTLYFWTHNMAISSQITGGQDNNYSADDYAMYNLTGGTKAASYISGGVVPNGKIGTGQAFFVEAAGTNGSKTVTFDNSMRVKSANGNVQFFRNQVTKNSTQSDQEDDSFQRNRVWVSISNNESAYSETLLGYITGATNMLDYGFDGLKLDGGNYVSLYSVLDENMLAIQGRDVNFIAADVVPLGFNSTISSEFKIKIENVDGFFAENQDVYLIDKFQNNAETNLRESDYTFTAEPGTYNNRFELRFVSATLGTDNPVANTNKIDVIRSANHIEITSNNEQLDSVTIFDMLGRNIYSKTDINETTFSTKELGIHGQVVIVKVKTTNNTEFTKKVIMN